MNHILRISFRNLIRQRSRNLLLGSAIAIGTMILVLANSFAYGITEVIFERIVSYVSGHVSISFSRDGNIMHQVFYDGERIKQLVRENVPEIQEFQEAIGTMGRVIGNGKADNCIIVGIDLKADVGDSAEALKRAEENFTMLEGKFEDIERTDVENPILISAAKAKSLNVKMYDIMRIRMMSIYGQNQSARLTVIGIYKPSNTFMSSVTFLDINNLKPMMGYGPHDIGTLQVNVKDPKKNAIPIADKLHSLLRPKQAVISASMINTQGAGSLFSVVGFRSDSASQPILQSAGTILAPDSGFGFWRDGVFATAAFCKSYGIGYQDTCRLVYQAKHTSQQVTLALPITGILSPDVEIPDNVILVNEKLFYKMFYTNWPAPPPEGVAVFVPDSLHPLSPVLATEWVLLERSKTTQEMQKKHRELGRKKMRAVVIDVRTMYETASVVIALETAMVLITFGAVLILFLVILVGVVNTLRMSIKERTREIGTVRAIGMQRKDIRRVFLYETILLSLFSALTGTILAFITMGLLIQIKFPSDNPLSMLLVNSHLHFAPTILSIIIFITLIVFMGTMAAFFPANRASKLLPADALRHYE